MSLHGDITVVDLKAPDVSFRTVHNRLVPGSLRASTYLVRFTPTGALPHEVSHLPHSFFHMPVASIERLVPIEQKTRDQTLYILEFLCKDIRCLQLLFRERAAMDQVFKVISKFAFPEIPGLLFAFQHRSPDIGATMFDGWDLYDMERDLRRQGTFTSRLSDGRPTWRCTRLNASFEYSPTYPRVLVVPTYSSDEALRSVARFRSRARIPALTFFHAANRTTLWRSSQPMVGVGGNTCREDEALLDQIRAGSATSAGQPLFIADCRPRINALGNKAKGKGYETYKHGQLVFLNIQSIHVMRDSINKVRSLSLSASGPDDVGFSTAVEDTGWLKHVRLVLAGGIRVAAAMHHGGQSVLCHCSDGWDRTAQVCCLAQMFLDPYYRTVEGFMALVSKDWLMFGHQFQMRVGHGSPEHDSSERSPVFLQFLDAVWQLTDQHPSAFEFSPRLLLFIAHHLYSCRFGDFLFHCMREREENEVPSKTPSMWGYILERMELWSNPFYKKDQLPVLLPPLSATVRNVRFWSDLYMRYSPVPSLPHAMDYHTSLETAVGAAVEVDAASGKAAAGSGAADGEGDGFAAAAAEAAKESGAIGEPARASEADSDGSDDEREARVAAASDGAGAVSVPRRNFTTVHDVAEYSLLEAQLLLSTAVAASGAGAEAAPEETGRGDDSGSGDGGGGGSASGGDEAAATSGAGSGSGSGGGDASRAAVKMMYRLQYAKFDHSADVEVVAPLSPATRRARGFSVERAEALGIGTTGAVTPVPDGTAPAGAAAPMPATEPAGEEHNPFGAGDGGGEYEDNPFGAPV